VTSEQMLLDTTSIVHKLIIQHVPFCFSSTCSHECDEEAALYDASNVREACDTFQGAEARRY